LAKVAKDGLTPQNPTAGLGRSSTIANTVAKQCATVRLNVTATDYRFSGIPNRVSAGLASVTLKNASKSEPHHLLMVRKKPGITTPAKELLEKDDDATMDFVTGTDDVKPGQTTVGIAYLTPSTYVVADFLPVGGKEGGQPHFTKGILPSSLARSPL
jgi:hypothetical protein